MYAVKILPINKITHKFLIRGHNQNERETAYSIIEKTIKKAKKSGSIYVPDQYVQIIRAAKKKGSQFNVEELNFDDFIDLKRLSDEIELNIVKDVDGNTIKTTELKVIEFQKDNDAIYKYKLKFDGKWSEAELRKKGPKSTNRRTAVKDINLVPAYTSKREISSNKRNDLKELLQKNVIPRYYSTFYESIL